MRAYSEGFRGISAWKLGFLCQAFSSRGRSWVKVPPPWLNSSLSPGQASMRPPVIMLAMPSAPSRGNATMFSMNGGPVTRSMKVACWACTKMGMSNSSAALKKGRNSGSPRLLPLTLLSSSRP